jgi:hypothetical protein
MLKNISKALLLILMTVLLPVFSSVAWSANLPLNRELTVRLSNVVADGSLLKVADAKATTDALGKITFSFISVPDSTIASFLHLQIIDGDVVLRQSIIPATAPGDTIEMGISEVTDFQARAALKAAAISGRLTSLHLLLAQTMFRSPGFYQLDAEQGGAAVAAAAAAMEERIIAEAVGAERLPGMLQAVAGGLGKAAAIYRKSVDESLWFDQKVEAYLRGEAFAELMQSFVNVGADAGIPLDTLSTAFAAAGSTAEASVASLPPDAIEAVRAGFITGMVQCGTYRYVRESVDALTAVGIFPGHFSKVSVELTNLIDRTAYHQKATEGDLFGSSVFVEKQAAVVSEFNALAIRDLTFSKFGLEVHSDWITDPTSEYASYLTSVAARMSGMGGVMAGTTPDGLKAFLDSSYQLAFHRQFLLAALNFLTPSSAFRYSPVPGLAEQVASPLLAAAPPDVGGLSSPYLDMVLFAYDMSLLASIRQSEFSAAENALPADPPSWLALETIRSLYDKDLQRRATVRQHMYGIDPPAQLVIMNLLQPFGEVM